MMMAQQKHKKWLYITAAATVVLPFLGVPQVIKTTLFVVVGLFVGYVAFLLPDNKEDRDDEPMYVENGGPMQEIQGDKNTE